KTAVWRRMASGMLPRYVGGTAIGGLPGEEVWKGVDVPILLIAGEADTITTPEEIEKIVVFFGKTRHRQHSTADNADIPVQVGPAKVSPLSEAETSHQASSDSHPATE